MALYAHARIEDPEDPTQVWERGDSITEEDVERLGLDAEYGAFSEDEYDPEADKNDPPQYIEIEGVRYERKAETEEDGDDA